MNKRSLIIILIVLLLVAIGGGAYYMLVLKAQVEDAKASTVPQQFTYALDDSFITNVKSSRKLLKTSIVLVSNDQNLQETLDSNKYVIRDTVLFILRDLTEEDISSETIQDTLRKEIPDALNKVLGITSIVSVYFGDFVMQ